MSATHFTGVKNQKHSMNSFLPLPESTIPKFHVDMEISFLILEPLSFPFSSSRN